MRVLLISANTETINMIPLPLGLNCVAVAARNAGHQVRLLDLMGQGDNDSLISRAVAEFSPDVIGISVRNVDDQQMVGTRFLLEPMRETVACCRTNSTAPIVLGGAGFSIFPEAMLRYLDADFGTCGEGEVALVRLLEALENGGEVTGIEGIVLPDRGLRLPASRCPLQDLPFPDPSLWNLPADPPGELWVPFQTRRGCPMRCSYCSTPALEGTAIRSHAVGSVVEALAAHVAAGFRRFYFVDNTFNVPQAYAKELCRALQGAKLGLLWRCILYPGFIDEELVRVMAESGCIEVSLGFESGSPAILESLNKRYQPEQVRQAARLLRKYGIRSMGFLLLGAPGETRETVEESLAFADTLALDLLKVSIGLRIYPGTALQRSALREGVLEQGDDLLLPRFYLARGLSGWIETRVRDFAAQRPYCMI